ncbi:MAG: hypothetical protein R3C99_09980 [Pirellulaceae bacterium]|nr:hypothetical protein [Planctomycetales bacterium]MCA9187398.1 hypothetical protein [Planctomycetales bacterium]MCA9205690.1 hypothetical protein [Planctomycetales bacterium]MCA9227530.1 hypothetical protein [Planctomycetales bacterium]
MALAQLPSSAHLEKALRRQLDEQLPQHGLLIEVYSGGVCVLRRLGMWHACGEYRRLASVISESSDVASLADRLRENGMLRDANKNARCQTSWPPGVSRAN